MSSSSIVSSVSNLYTNLSVANASSIIKTLPPEILGKIASFFDNCKDAVYLGLAHPRLYCVLSYAPLWDRFFQKDFPDSYAKLQPPLEKSPALYKQFMNRDCNMKAGKSDLQILRWPNEKINQMIAHEGMIITSSCCRRKVLDDDDVVLFQNLTGVNLDHLTKVNLDLNIKILDLKTKKELHTLNNPHSRQIFNILVCAGKLISYSDKTIKIWDLKTGKELDQKVVGQQIRSMAACNGKLVAGLENNTILVWNLDEAQKEVKILAGHPNWLSCTRIFCDGQLISGGSYGDPTIKVWNFETAEELHTLNKHRLSITCMAVCNGELITGSDDNTIKICDLKTADELYTLRGHQESIACILVHRGMLISSSEDGVIKIWDLKTRQELWTLNQDQSAQEEDGINYLMAYDDMLISSTRRGEIKIWNLKTGEKLIKVAPQKSDSSLPIYTAAHDGEVISSADNEIKIWDFNVPYESFPLLRELGIVTKKGYSVILKCSPDDLAQRGICSPDDLQALFNSPNLQRLEFIPEEVTNDRLQRRDRAFKKQQIVSDFLDQLLTAAEQKSEEAMLCSVFRDADTVVYEAPNPWIDFQGELRCYQASLTEIGLTEQEFCDKFNSDYAKIVREVNALIDMFRKLERGTKILRLRAYIHQADILKVWENLRTQGINSLSALFKQGNAPQNIFRMRVCLHTLHPQKL